jgi:thiamine-phosphate pyrophosphorylase
MLMHNKTPRIYTFIESFDKEKISKLPSTIGIIYRNYNTDLKNDQILKIKDFCKANNKKIYLANNFKLAFQNKLDGVYIPSFNRNLNFKNLNKRKNFIILGSAHNLQEIKIKEKQCAKIIFLSPVFKTKNYKKILGISKFNFLARQTKKRIVALGGINKKNINYLKISKIFGFSAIKYFNNKNEQS